MFKGLARLVFNGRWYSFNQLGCLYSMFQLCIVNLALAVVECISFEDTLLLIQQL